MTDRTNPRDVAATEAARLLRTACARTARLLARLFGGDR